MNTIIKLKNIIKKHSESHALFSFISSVLFLLIFDVNFNLNSYEFYLDFMMLFCSFYLICATSTVTDCMYDK